MSIKVLIIIVQYFESSKTANEVWNLYAWKKTMLKDTIFDCKLSLNKIFSFQTTIQWGFQKYNFYFLLSI